MIGVGAVAVVAAVVQAHTSSPSDHRYHVELYRAQQPELWGY
jgi:hypothetical protein